MKDVCSSVVAMKEKFKGFMWSTQNVVAVVVLLWAASASWAAPSLEPDFPSFPSFPNVLAFSFALLSFLPFSFCCIGFLRLVPGPVIPQIDLAIDCPGIVLRLAKHLSDLREDVTCLSSS